MRITKVELFHIAIPLKRPFYPAWIPGYPQTKNQFTLLRLTADTGHQGLAAGMAFSTERKGLGDLIAPYLLGLDPLDIETVHQRLREVSYLGWRNFWIEAAFYDLWSRAEDQPLWKLLGGTDTPAPVYWSTGAVCKPKTHAKIVQRAEKEGYHGVKLRVHAPTLDADVAVVQKVRKRVGREYPLMVDANQGWPVTIVDRVPNWDLARAKRFVAALADANIHWLEEPLDMHAYEALAQLRTASPIKIAGGELNYGWQELKMLLHFGSLDLYQPDATFSGIVDTLRVIDATKKQGLGFNPHTWTNGFGLMVNLHTYALTDRAVPLEYPYEPGSWEPAVRDGILAHKIVPENGELPMAQTPGIVEVDWARVERFGSKIFSMTEKELKKRVVGEKGLLTALKLKRRKDRQR